MRPKQHDRHLPQCMYHRHGAYYYVKRGKWERLSADYAIALQEYALRVDKKAGGMAELIDRVFEHIKPNLADNTVKQYDQARRRLREILMDFAPEQVRPKHVAAIKTELASTPNMANRLISFLRVVFQHAVEWQVVESNPCIGVRRHKEAKRDRLMSEAEFLAIRAAAAHKAIPAVMELCLLTGQRISDILSLRNDQIGLAGISFQQKKTGTKLVVRMSPDLEAAIATARAAHPRKIGPAGTYETLLYTRGGRPYSYGTIRDAFNRAKDAAGVVGVTIHDMRAKSGTDAEDQGMDPQKLLGHSNPQQTKRYLRGKKGLVVDGPKMGGKG
jgi:integrase